MQTIEKTTLSQLLHNENFNRKVIPFLKSEYFGERSEKILFEEINDFVDKYKNPPTKPALEIEIDKRKDLSEVEHKKVLELLSSLEDSKVEYDWLVDTVEKFCKDKAVYNAIMESIQIIDGKSKEKTEGSIPTILSDALSVSFDTHIGHDYIEDSDASLFNDFNFFTVWYG